jgi:Pentapeptide repeats (8 copies)
VKALRRWSGQGLIQPVIVGLVLLLLAAVVAIAFLLQLQAERDALTPVSGGSNVREQREIDKLNAEIRQIRSDTGGSLFWLKLAGLFVTVGAAVGGYLLGQSRNTRERLDAERRVTQERLEFEHRQNIDASYHALVEQLTVDSPLLRAASAMRLGKLLEAPPVEWHVTPDRQRELGDLTEQILAAALAIEKEPKVLKALTMALALHPPDAKAGDLQELDLSGAKAVDAYWARIDFRYADFYRADLTHASLREAKLQGAQFRETVLRHAVLAEAKCEGANFKLADLRGADLRGADLKSANFENVKVFGAKLDGALIGGNPDCSVDVSPKGDGSKTIGAADWLADAVGRG